MPLVAFCLCHFLADFIICTCEFEFRQAQRSSHADCVPWASGTSLLHRPHPGRMAGAKLAIAAGICLVDVNMALACTERECSDVYGPSFVEIASDRCRGGLTSGSIPFVEFPHQLDQLLEQHRRVILAIAHDDRRDHLRLVEIDETCVVSSQASH